VHSTKRSIWRTATRTRIELNRAELGLKRGLLAEARECCDRAYELFTRVGSQSGLGESCKFYGVLFRGMQRPALARVAPEARGRVGRSCEDRLLEAEAQNECALLHLDQGDNRTALERLNRAHRLFTDLRARAELMDVDGRLDRLEETYLEVVRAWGESIESKDRYTAGHCGRVADHACMLADALGFTGRDLTWIRMGGFLHDVGKIAVPETILNKTGRLTDDEFEIMKSHTTAGDVSSHRSTSPTTSARSFATITSGGTARATRTASRARRFRWWLASCAWRTSTMR
jgi:hypothetical protein